MASYYSSNGALEQTFFRPNPGIPPNLIGHFVAAAFMTFLSPVAAEKVLLGIYVCCLPLAFRYALRGVSKATEGIECLIFPFIYNMHFHWGFYNFCYGLVLYLIGLGFFLRSATRQTVGRWITFAILITLTYLSHPIAIAELGLTVFIVIAVGALLGRRTLDDSIRFLVYAGTAFLPAVLISLQFLLYRVRIPGEPLVWPTIRYAAYNILYLAPLATFSRVERTAGLCFAIFLALLLTVSVARVLRGATDRRPWEYVVCAFFLSVVIFVTPASVLGGTMFTPRLVYFPVFLLCLWLTAEFQPFRWRAISAAVALTIAMVLMVSRFPVYASYNQTMQEFLSIDRYLQPQKTLLFQTLANPFPQNLEVVTKRPNLSGGAGAYLAALHQDIYLSDYEAETNHFPFLFQVRYDPGRVFAGGSGAPIPSCVSLRKYLEQSGQPVDYLVFWNSPTNDGSRLDAEYGNCGYHHVGPEDSRVQLFSLESQ
jgi:hypothetical protein